MAGLGGDKGWAERQEAGKDTQSVIADSLFMDPEPGDLRLQPGSPAAQIGFESWGISDVGPRPFPADSKWDWNYLLKAGWREESVTLLS